MSLPRGAMDVSVMVVFPGQARICGTRSTSLSFCQSIILASLIICVLMSLSRGAMDVSVIVVFPGQTRLCDLKSASLSPIVLCRRHCYNDCLI